MVENKPLNNDFRRLNTDECFIFKLYSNPKMFWQPRCQPTLAFFTLSDSFWLDKIRATKAGQKGFEAVLVKNKLFPIMVRLKAL